MYVSIAALQTSFVGYSAMKMSSIKKKKKKEKERLKDYALSELTTAGTIFPNEPKAEEEYMTLPADLTSVSNRDLGKYLNAFTQQKVYVNTLLAVAEVNLIEFEEEYNKNYSEYYHLAPYDNVNDKKEYAKKKTLEERELYAKAKSVLTLAVRNIESLNDIIFLISREQTRRTAITEQEYRNGNK